MRVKSNKLALRVLSTATFLAMVSSCATAAFAGTYYMEKGSISIVAKTDGNYITQGDINDKKDEGETVITNHDSETASKNTVTIKAEEGSTANVTLDNVNIDASDTDKAAIHTEGNVTLELDGDNTLTGGEGHAALEKYSSSDKDYTLTLQDETTGDGKTGSLTANGGAEGGAGIGGGKGTAASAKSGGSGVTITDGTVTATGGKGAAGIGSGAGSRWKLGSFVDITGGTVTANGGAGEAAGIGSGENDAGVSTVKLSATTAKLDVTAMTLGSGEAISGENGVTMASLTNVLSGVVRFFRGTNHYNTVHNGKYVGMADNNADEHQETDAHIWGSTEIIRQATPTEQGHPGATTARWTAARATTRSSLTTLPPQSL